jgi:6-phosphogluconate dehydrogenase
MDIVEANPNKPWSWKTLSENKFAKEKEQFELRVKHQKFVQEHLFEEFVKAYMHPNRILKLLDMGYTIDELDDIL